MPPRETIATRIVSFLENHRPLNIVLVIAYSFFILLGHDHFVQLSILVMNKLSLPVYNQRVMQLMLFLGLTMIGLTLFHLYKNPSQWIAKLLFLLGCSLLLGWHVAVLFEMNIEIIHVAEFVLLALLLFSFTRSIGSSLIYALPVMVADELNQYLLLYPTYNKYFEWSDIVLDITGAGTILLMLHIAGLSILKKQSSFWKNPALLWLLAAALVVVIGIATCTLATTTNTSCAHSIFVFNRLDNPELFWQVHAFTGARYHVLLPMEGLGLVVGVCLYFLSIDAVLGKES